MNTKEVKRVVARVAARKPYQTPMLTVYGDAKSLTQAVGSAGKPDGVGRGKTQLKTA